MRSWRVDSGSERRHCRGRLRSLGICAIAALAAGCASAAVKTRSSPSFDVSAYRTYEWGTPAPVVIADEERERDAAVLEWTIRDAVDRTLEAKGYRQIVGGSPDFVVDFGIRLEEKSADTFGQYITYRDAGGQQGLGGAFVFGYEEGVLAIEIADARSKTRLWSGSARTVLDDGQDVTKLEQAARRILADFPARSDAAPPPPTTNSSTRAVSEPQRGDVCRAHGGVCACRLRSGRRSSDGRISLPSGSPAVAPPARAHATARNPVPGRRGGYAAAARPATHDVAGGRAAVRRRSDCWGAAP